MTDDRDEVEIQTVVFREAEVSTLRRRGFSAACEQHSGRELEAVEKDCKTEGSASIDHSMDAMEAWSPLLPWPLPQVSDTSPDREADR